MIAVARATVREISRRRSSLVLLILLPLAFYLARHQLQGQSLRLLSLGLGWTVSTLALFVAVGAADVERRLRVAGYTTSQLLGGRWLAVTVVGLVLAAVDLVVVLVDQELQRPAGVALMLVTAVVLGAPLGTLVGALLRRELEGALALLIVLSMQMLSDPEGSLAKGLPFWSIPQLAFYTVDEKPVPYLTSGLGHAAVTWLLLVLGMYVVTAVRLRVHRLPMPRQDAHATSGT